MFVLSNFISALARVLDILLNLYMWLIVIRAIASWFSPDPYNPIYQFLIRITEPVLGYIRRFIPLKEGIHATITPGYPESAVPGQVKRLRNPGGRKFPGVGGK
jgi:uncharacterized protein YggT (Ycf19 family)